MKRYKERFVALVSALAIIVSSSGITTLAYKASDIPSYYKLSNPVSIGKSAIKRTGSIMAWDPKKTEPTYKYEVNGIPAVCASASKNNPANNAGKVYELDATGIAKYSIANGNSAFLRASNNPVVTGTEGTDRQNMWIEAIKASDLNGMDDYEVYQRLLTLIHKDTWTKDLTITWANVQDANDTYNNNYGATGYISKWGGYEHIESSDSDFIGKKFSGLYATVHAMLSYGLTDSYEERFSVSSLVVIGNSQAANSRSEAIKLMTGYFNEIADQKNNNYQGFLAIPNNATSDANSGPQWLLYTDGSKILPKAAYARFAVYKESAFGDKMRQASFTVYSDAECTQVLGTITDEDGNGVYSDFSNIDTWMEDGESASEGLQKDDRLRLKREDDGVFERTVWIKETGAPVDCGSITLTEDIVDNTVYKMVIHTDFDDREMTVMTTGGSGSIPKQTFEVTSSDDAPQIIVANNNKETFVDGAGVKVSKDTHNGFTVKNTTFSIYRGTDTNSEPVVSHEVTEARKVWSYPLMANTQYTIVEAFTVDSYKGSDINVPYEVENTSGWTKINDNSYCKTFATGDHGSITDLTNGGKDSIYNDRVTVKLTLTKDSADDVLKDHEFTFYYLGKDSSEGNDTKVATAKTDDNGKISLELPTGYYRIHETADQKYKVTWGSNVEITSSGDAIVHLTRAESNLGTMAGVNVDAVNEVYAAPIRVTKVDSKNPNTNLKGAYFAIYEDTNDNGKFDTNDKPAKTYLKDSKEWKEVVFSEESGYYQTVYVNGSDYNEARLFSGTYFVIEKVAPELHLLMEDPIKITIPKITDPDCPPVSSPEPVEAKVVNEIDFSTTATGVNDTKVIEYSEDKPVTLTDRVHFANLISDKEYTLTGTLYLNEDGNAVRADKIEPVTVKFKPSDKNVTVEKSEKASDGTTRITGTVDVVFTFNIKDYAGKKIVAFETLDGTSNGAFVHADINDADQTIEIPDIGTTLKDVATDSKVVSYGPEIKLVDTVSYTHLIPGKTYVMTGTLMIKNSDGTGTPLYDKGKGLVTSSVEFTPESADGTVEVEFVFDSTSLTGKTLVAFETCTYDGIEVAVHADINDAEQTVKVPLVMTTAASGNGKSQIVEKSDKVKIIDHVYYENLEVGREYRVEGVIMNRTTGEVFKNNDAPVTASAVFTPEEANGEGTVTFNLDTRSLGNGDELVVFERVYDGDTLVGLHENIDDKDQTVTVTEYKTGDYREYRLYIAGLIGSITSLAGFALFRSRRKHSQSPND